MSWLRRPHFHFSSSPGSKFIAIFAQKQAALPGRRRVFVRGGCQWAQKVRPSRQTSFHAKNRTLSPEIFCTNSVLTENWKIRDLFPKDWDHEGDLEKVIIINWSWSRDQSLILWILRDHLGPLPNQCIWKQFHILDNFPTLLSFYLAWHWDSWLSLTNQE